MYTQSQEYDWWLNNGLKGANDYVNYLRTSGGPDSEEAIANFEAYIEANRPDVYEQYQTDKNTGSQSGYGASGRANMLLGESVADAENTEAQIEALGLKDYTYNATLEDGAGYQLADKVEHAGAVDPLTLQMQQDAINQERTDTMGVDAQKGVLGEYANLYGQGGLSAIDRARMARARQVRATQAKGDRGAIMQRMEQMGRAGGNAELLAQLDAQGQAEQALAMDDLETESMALQRRDSMLRDAGNLGGQVQTAQDAIDRFNTLGERDRIKQNLDRENEARGATWTEVSERDTQFAADKNAAHGAQFSEDSARNARNANRRTEASRFNVSPTQGRRGQIDDMARARQLTAGARESVATNLTGAEARRDAKSAAQTAAIIGLTGTAGEIGTSVYNTAANDDDDDEEE